ncbi:MAG: hypothetical protein A2951_02360 [Candidatus Buchananbacteria bacterium RIFCSPLOWO2_01_FULL_56_15]|uniref:GxxExxY protein n=2 Tax=Candidatus Buchananiibacteriota TaxID=1817903 RepID=A0A1G1YLG7_9BACT|nr:MAG: hypothetical protein A3J59_02280 [Candidatus Buchananbacteria bacterium RIFCSPHIGHO2_02_FULL_56_16]OGY54562.1 MAG: hypothetical protein A2951_02360 [Candidatus Buchananbacteria bacterium RIFCSPLOWO2_01_FULL_56_15]
MLEKIIYPELSYKVTGLCFQAQNELGRFAKEKQYAERLEQLFKASGVQYAREVSIPFKQSEYEVGGNIADFIVEGKIILECKAKRLVTRQDYYQAQRYLNATNIKLGLIVNFRDRYVKPKRVINYSQHSHSFVN